MKSLLAVLLLVVGTGIALGVESDEQEFTCPIDGTRWKERVERSARPGGLRLDLRQIGDVVDPPTLPQCPKCRLPLFDHRMSKDLAELLKPFVLGADFQMIAAKNPSYFCLAQVQEFLRAPRRNVALTYLRASWQVERKGALCRRYLELARGHFAAALTDMKSDDPHFVNTMLLCGEVERRLGDWTAADKRFREIERRDEFKEPRLQTIIDAEKKLIRARDDRPHVLGGPDEKVQPGDLGDGKADNPEKPAVP